MNHKKLARSLHELLSQTEESILSLVKSTVVVESRIEVNQQLPVIIDHNSGESEHSSLAVARAFSSVLEARDRTSFSWSKKVAFVANKVGCFFHLSREQLIELKMVSYLHDIGNVSVPDSILFKKGSLTEAEYNTIKIHPLISSRLAGEIPFVNEAITGAIRHHHEKFDGSGYPDRLSGKDIPLLSSIISIADAMVAMLSKKHYRNPLPFLEVIDEIKKQSGLQFDPKLAEVIDDIFPDDPLKGHF